MLLTTFVMLVFSDPQRLYLEPVDLPQDSPVFYSYLRGFISYQQGYVLYSRHSSKLLWLDAQAKPIGHFGTSGQGPSDISNGVFGIASYKEFLWVIDGPGKILTFVNGEFDRSFKTPLGVGLNMSNASCIFGANENHLVIYTPPSSEYAAQVMDYEGNLVHKLLLKKEMEVLPAGQSSFWHLTSWIWHQQKWYCFPYYSTTFYVFDKNFNRIETNAFDNAPFTEILDDYHKAISQVNGEHSSNYNKSELNSIFQTPLISDLKIHNNTIHAVTGGGLSFFDLKGKRLKSFRLYGNGPEFERINQENKDLYLFYCQPLSNNSIWLGHPGMMWGHDFWKVEIPEN